MAKRRRAALEAEDADFETTEGVKAIGSFEEMGIKDDLLRGIYQYGFEKPSAIQQRAVTPIIQGRDVIAQAQSGTGKSSMIALTVCQIVDTSVREVQALIVSPTRELASQTEKVILAIGDFINIQAHACIGGKSEGEDMSKLEYGVHVVSGTPGRVCDMIKRRTLRTRAIKLLVLDESDEMLSRGFKDQIYDVYRYLPPDLQVVLISATLPHEILEMTNKFMTDPVRILVKRDELTLERTQSDRERGRKRESESERSHGSGRGRGSDREERKEKKKVENNEFDDDDDNGRRNNRSLKSRHERSPEHHRNGKRSHRSHSPPQPHASTAANGKPLDEVSGDIQP
ncbi:hypothetical protein TanjilG_00271 [Lupinus angustifolius]|uniref:RNA helicase n=1 Tax=Lupinus angustifolius TaxID=3871 RepID=A0A4P1QQL7_LUPAN|nr:hypothetical protein TanjilG_00271 [Lupinus angustifolius]